MKMRMMVLGLVALAGCGGGESASSAPPPNRVLAYFGVPDEVNIGMHDTREASCARGDVLLRENVATGEVVQIAQCDAVHVDSWVDRCAPAGEYRYGLAKVPESRPSLYWCQAVKLDAPRTASCATTTTKWGETPPWVGPNALTRCADVVPGASAR